MRRRGVGAPELQGCWGRELPPRARRGQVARRGRRGGLRRPLHAGAADVSKCFASGITFPVSSELHYDQSVIMKYYLIASLHFAGHLGMQGPQMELNWSQLGSHWPDLSRSSISNCQENGWRVLNSRDTIFFLLSCTSRDTLKCFYSLKRHILRKYSETVRLGTRP